MKAKGISALLSALLILSAIMLFSAKHPSSQVQAPSVTKSLLGAASVFAVLGASTVTNTGPTVVNGNLGVSPGNAITGFPPGLVHGVIHKADSVASKAQDDITTAYNTIAGQACTHDLTGQDLGGKTLTSGVYCFSSSAQLTGQLTLDGQGNPDSVFLFQIGSTLTTASNARVVLLNDAQPCNIFWKIGSSATLGTSTDFSGNILALASITATTGARFNGGLYARSGAVTLDTNVITRSSCMSEGGTPTPTGTRTPEETPMPTRIPTRIPTYPGMPNTGSDPHGGRQ